MAEVLLFHHAQGLTEGVVAFADRLREAGHTVHTPDLYDGHTFQALDEGIGYAQEISAATRRESTPSSPPTSCTQGSHSA